jgi:acyl-CoA thioesterase YciA
MTTHSGNWTFSGRVGRIALRDTVADTTTTAYRNGKGRTGYGGAQMTSDWYLALQVLMMPAQVNAHGTIFGGVLLSHIDQAGAVGAVHEVVLAGGAEPSVVTVAINRVEFKQPVLVGDLVRFQTRLGRMGRTSVTVQVRVEAQRGRQLLHVTEAELVYVGVDLRTPERKPKPLLAEG